MDHALSCCPVSESTSNGSEIPTPVLRFVAPQARYPVLPPFPLHLRRRSHLGVGRCKWITRLGKALSISHCTYLAGTLTAKPPSLSYNITSPTKLQTLLSRYLPLHRKISWMLRQSKTHIELPSLMSENVIPTPSCVVCIDLRWILLFTNAHPTTPSPTFSNKVMTCNG